MSFPLPTFLLRFECYLLYSINGCCFFIVYYGGCYFFFFVFVSFASHEITCYVPCHVGYTEFVQCVSCECCCISRKSFYIIAQSFYIPGYCVLFFGFVCWFTSC